MNPTTSLRAAHRPLIKFIGHHKPPAQINHTPQPHPASQSASLPDSFASYRKKAQQHGPLNGGTSVPMNGSRQSTISYGGNLGVGSHAGSQLGAVQPPKGSGTLFDRNELPKRFHRLPFTEGELEAVDSGGATKVW